MVDLIGPYKIRGEVQDGPLILKDLTMIDFNNGWFEIVQYNDQHTDTIPNLLEQAWICRYPRPKIFTYDLGNEFLEHAFKNDLV